MKLLRQGQAGAGRYDRVADVVVRLFGFVYANA
jgi:hypothetical protein